MIKTFSSLAKSVGERWANDRAFAIWTTSLLAFALRVAASMALKSYDFSPARDYWAFGFEWGRIAKWLAETGFFSLDGKTPTADTDPLYIFLIAPFFYFFGSFSTSAAIALILFQSVLCALTVWAAFVLAERLFGSFEARVAALLLAFYPASVFFAISRIGPSSLAALLLCLVFLAALRLPRSRGPGIAILTGALTGIVVLTSSDNLSLMLVVPLWLFLAGTGQRGRMVLQGSVVVVVAILVLVPWSLRNSAVSGEATISKANLGYHLYVGNNPHATGYYYSSVPPELKEKAGDYRQSEYYSMALSWIAQHPGEFAILTLKRIQYFWYVIEGRGNSAKERLQAWILLTLLAFAGAGAFWPGRKSEGVGLIWLFVALYPLVFYLTHASFYRHRYHVEPFVLILASHGLHGLWEFLPLYKQRIPTPSTAQAAR